MSNSDAGEDIALIAKGSCRRGRIIANPSNFYGDRTCRARDWGHIWTFGVTVAVKTAEEWDAEGGFTTKTRLDD
jgi:hypothetical protein